MENVSIMKKLDPLEGLLKKKAPLVVLRDKFQQEILLTTHLVTKIIITMAISS